jgi:putative PIN family toxin of toxin-antitoxin system
VTVVFDSGIWISAMQFGGTPLEAVVEAIAQDRFAVCDQIEEEVVRVLTRKFGWEAERVRADLAFYWQEALRVEFQGSVAGVCRDPKDEPILECAETGDAQHIVSGDRDLLSLGSYHGIRIITAREYVERSCRGT